MHVSGQLNGSAALPLGKKTHGTLRIGGWVDPRVGLDAVKKNLYSAGNQTLVVHPVAMPTEKSRVLDVQRLVKEFFAFIGPDNPTSPLKTSAIRT
jgi:hypothetical protein